MKFNIFNYSQLGAISLKLDLKDLLILDWFQTFQPRMHKIIHEQEQFYWINYEKLLQDIPIVEIATSKGLYKRLQNLCEIGILKHCTKRTNGGCYSYYLITDMIKILISPESSFAKTPEVPLQSPESSEHKDSSIIHSSTINSCNAMQGQATFSKEKKEYDKFPPSFTQNLSHEAFKEEWQALCPYAPAGGLDKAFATFEQNCVKMSISKQKEFGTWKRYLKEEWALRDFSYQNYQKSKREKEVKDDISHKSLAEASLSDEQIVLNAKLQKEGWERSIVVLKTTKEEWFDFNEEFQNWLYSQKRAYFGLVIREYEYERRLLTIYLPPNLQNLTHMIPDAINAFLYHAFIKFWGEERRENLFQNLQIIN